MDNGSKTYGLDEVIEEKHKILEKYTRDNETVHMLKIQEHELFELKKSNAFKSKEALHHSTYFFYLYV